MSGITIGVHLPKIDLPKFDGKLEKWTTFKDAFKHIIHAHPNLSDIQKLSYLRLSLTGKAASAIESLTISEDDYKVAWNQLLEDYDNTRALVLRHSSLLIDTSAMPDDSSDSTRDLVNHMQSHIRSLRALGRSWENIANDLLTNIAISKMHPETRKSWEITLVDTRMPEIEDVFKHLRNVSHRCESTESTATTSKPNRTQTNVQADTSRWTKKTRRSPPTSPRLFQRRIFVTNATENCKVCDSGTHPAYVCPRFLSMTMTERESVANKLKWCKNCLRPGHLPDQCYADRCRVCNGRHHTKLHRDTASTYTDRDRPE
ncbi:uncharacterized protein LOC144478129 [Augochlora pura]